VVTDLSNALAAALRISRGAPVSTIAISAFAGGIVVGGSAVWLSGASRHVGAEPEPVQPAAVVSQAPISPATPAHARSFTDVELPAVASRTRPAAPAGSKRPQFRGSLIVNSRPSGAKVFLNGRSVGTTPLVLRNQAAGSRAVRVAMDGYESWSSAVQVNAFTETRLRAELKAERPSAQP
jgi:PEGA domain-containing protein